MVDPSAIGQSPHNRRAQWSWALYDWANSAFATTVMAGFFPVFFKSYWAAGMSATDSTVRLGTANALASLLVVLLAPVLGILADRASHKKRLLLFMAMLGALMSGGLFLVAEGQWLLAVLLYVFGVLGFAGGNVTYDAMLLDVAERGQFERVSALGFALGYLGGGLLFAINVADGAVPRGIRAGRQDRGGPRGLSDGGGVVGGVHDSGHAVRARAAAPASAGGWAGVPPDLAGTGRDLVVCCAVCAWHFCFCSPTGATSTASTPSCAWRSTTACRWVLRPRVC